MNIERIRELAKQADLDWHKHSNDDDSNKLEKFAALVAFAEREECARVCEKILFWESSINEQSAKIARIAAFDCAVAIRTRKKK